MSYDKNIYRKLSAYIDGELSATEKAVVEEELKKSSALREEYAKLKKIRQAVSSVKPLPEDPFFETRLMERIKSESTGFFSFMTSRKPVIAFAVLTVAVMIFFKFNPNPFGEIIEQQKANLVEFYTNNLEPLFTGEDVSNEDVFNFAFSGKLPLNRNNDQVLSLGESEDGKPYFEVRETGLEKKGMDLSTFIRTLNLNAHKQAQLDSILENYSTKITQTVYVNPNNALAVNQNLYNFQNALRAELLSFAADADKEIFRKIVPADFQLNDNKRIATFIEEAQENQDNDNFLFFTPETIFTVKLDLHLDTLERDLFALKKLSRLKQQEKMIVENQKYFEKNRLRYQTRIKKNSEEFDSILAHSLRVLVDSEYCKVELPDHPRVHVTAPDMDKIRDEMEVAIVKFNEVSMQFQVDTAGPHKSFNFRIGEDSDIFDMNIHIDSSEGSRSFRFNINVGPDNKQSFRFEVPQFNHENFKLNLDSLTHIYRKKGKERKALLEKIMPPKNYPRHRVRVDVNDPDVEKMIPPPEYMPDMEQYMRLQESVKEQLKNMEIDSLGNLNLDMRIEIRELKKEMEEFKEEMEKWKKDVEKSVKKPREH